MKPILVFVLLVSFFLTVGFASSDEVEQLRIEFETMKHRMKSMEIELESLKNSSVRSDRSSNAQGHLSKRLAEIDVAFHAYQSRVTCAENHQVIVYNTATINQGGGYNTADGIFDAPVSGLYLFSWTTASQDENWLVTELIVNGVRKGLIGTDTSDTDVTPGTAVVLATVNANDHVFIRRVIGGGCDTQRLQDTIRISFTGILLR